MDTDVIAIRSVVKESHQLGLITKDPDKVTEYLVEQYSQPHRKYHNLKHIVSMLETAKYYGISSPKLRLAILYHDVEYSNIPAFSRENEYRSMLRAAVDGVDPEVVVAIGYTAHHQQDQLNIPPLAMALLDCDLAFLADTEQFDNALIDVAEEYSVVYDMSVDSVLKSQEKFLTSLLSRNELFYQLSELEKAARANLEKLQVEWNPIPAWADVMTRAKGPWKNG